MALISKKPEIILVMGETGVGKSTFIQRATGDKAVEIGHTMHPGTEEVGLSQMPGTHIFLLDTPGLGDERKNDSKVVKEVNDCLSNAFTEKWEIAGALFLQPINDTRMRGSTLRYMRLFGKIVGFENLNKCCFVTTKWTTAESYPGQFQQNETELREHEAYWKTSLDRGATYARFLDDSESRTQKSIHGIVGRLVRDGTVIIPQLVNETQEKGLKLCKTAAGREVVGELEQERISLQEDIQEVKRSEARVGNRTCVGKAEQLENERKLVRFRDVRLEYERDLLNVEERKRILDQKYVKEQRPNPSKEKKARRPNGGLNTMDRWIISTAGIAGTVIWVVAQGTAVVPLITVTATWLTALWS